MKTFEQLGLESQLLDAIDAIGFKEPMPVQREVIPHLLSNTISDMIAQAQTGTGKTAAFGLPIVQLADTSVNTTQYLILSPTRELCMQIASDLTNFSKHKPRLKIVTIYGGASIENQIKQLRKGAHIISATPGRLLDMLNRRVVDLSKIKTVILDEADEMLNMGFRPDLEAILGKTPENKNTLLFSATMSSDVRSIANRYMKQPVEISVGKRNAGVLNIDHHCYTVRDKDKYEALKRLASSDAEMYGIIFCRTRRETNLIAETLVRDGFSADALHGDLSQPQRDSVMKKFRDKRISLLVATDVAARGLDVNNLTHIINYQLPDDSEVYVHRSGRTGRIGKQGISVVLVNNREARQLSRIERQLQKKFELHQLPSRNEIRTTQIHSAVDRLTAARVDTKKMANILPEITQKLAHLDRDELIEKFVALELEKFPDHDHGSADLNQSQVLERSGKRDLIKEKYTRFFINIGKSDQLEPAILIGMINDFTGNREIPVGQIEILNNFSFFETDSSYTAQILSSFNSRKIKKRPIILEKAEAKSTRKNTPVRKNRKRKSAIQI